MKSEKRKNSALKKLIPAVAMLATSAVMLSTATYAWFTMNKEVKMTGLNMTATVGEGIEIALAEVDGTTLTFPTNGTAPSDTKSDSWKSAVVVGNYYTSFGKIKPSSSVDGKTFFDATNASDGGKVASTFKSVDAATTDSGFIVTQTALNTGNATVATNDTTGYYIDIPVHIRTSKSAESGEGAIYYKMTIDNAGDAEGKDLFNAVRVAFIKGDNSTVILGADNTYYEAGAVSNIDANGNGTKAAVALLKSGQTGAVFASDTSTEYTNSTGVDSGLTIPYATTPGAYGHLDFTVRVWLEGESKFCYDEKAGQSWNINLAFSLGEFDTPTTP
ncbi:MAG: hypothetical protein ACI4KR_13895 [Ruminiclostridium sp.]